MTAATKATTITAFDVRTLNPFRFSSEYADDTLGLVYYNYRHYEPAIGRWMSRDPKRYEDNIFSYLANDSINIADWLGLEFNVKHHESSEVPFGGWKSPESSAETRMIKIVDISIVPSQEGCPRGCYRFAVVFPDVRVDVYYRDDYARIQCYPDEMEHVACYERWYEKLANIAKTAESMSCMSPSDINKALDSFDKQDSNAADECDKCTQELDAKGGRHGH